VLPVFFMPAARSEIREASEWYADREPDLGTRFTAEIGRTVERIATAPLPFPVVLRDVRRARCRHVPDALFFRIADGSVYVIACFHSSRDPRRWRQRT
jgi:plasmid stabilization system protein ParE